MGRGVRGEGRGGKGRYLTWYLIFPKLLERVVDPLQLLEDEMAGRAGEELGVPAEGDEEVVSAHLVFCPLFPFVKRS